MMTFYSLRIILFKLKLLYLKKKILFTISFKEPSLGIMRWRSPWWWLKHRSGGEPILF